MAVLLVAIAAAWFSFVTGGVPLLRHDWFPVVPGFTFAIANVGGWDPTGIGAPNGYPASFLAIFVRSAVAQVAGSYATHLLFFAGCALLLVFGAARLCRVLGAPPVAWLAAALFAAFNPWTYTQLVAGHTFMLLSYAATFWVIAECCTRQRSEVRLVPLAFVLAPQIQFLIINVFLYGWLAARMRSWRTLAALAAALLPVAAGVALSRGALLGIPLTLEWERSQSLWPLRAVILRGYFAQYDAGFAPFVEWAAWFVAALAFAGVILIAATRRRELWLVAFAAVPLVWSFGLDGPLAAVFGRAIVAVPELALFRELYDLLAFVAIGYVAFCAVAAARAKTLAYGRLVAYGWLVAGGALAAGWFLSPPQRYWVPSQDLPAVRIPEQHDARFALMPAIFPAGFGERGSGTDPDLYARTHDRNPVNEAFSLYPVSAAVGSFMRDGDIARLAALGVRNVVVRPWLDTDPAVRYQFALPAPAWMFAPVTVPRSIASATPDLSVGALPAVGTLASNLGAGNVLASDARDVSGPYVPQSWGTFAPVVPVRPGAAFVNARAGWVDARLAFLERPELAQAYGGALTTDPGASLAVVPGRMALVWVQGRLVASDGRTLAAETAGYRWIAVPPGVTALRCIGLCVVAAQGQVPPGLPLDPPRNPARAVAVRVPLPWLVFATLPPGASGLLRYNVTFDPKWAALYDGARLPHLRVDGVVNGWILPPRRAQGRVVLIEWGALAVACSELVSAGLTLALLGGCVRTAYHGRVRSRRLPKRHPRIASGADG